LDLPRKPKRFSIVRQDTKIMSREWDIETWIAVAFTVIVGSFAGWLVVFHGWNENAMRATTYTAGIFLLLALVLRPAWHRRRFWVDLAISFAVHGIAVLSLLKFLDAHSIRLNWVLALPVVAVEMLLLLGVLWRRNVTNSCT
jgi:hypothetical protein